MTEDPKSCKISRCLRAWHGKKGGQRGQMSFLPHLSIATATEILQDSIPKKSRRSYQLSSQKISAFLAAPSRGTVKLT